MTTPDDFLHEAALHPEGSQAQKLLTWAAIELPDRAARIEELEEDETSRMRECEGLREALRNVKAALEVVSVYANSEAFSMGEQNTTFTRDFAPWVNLMGIHHKDPDYGRPDKPTGHIDTKRPRKSKATA